MTSPKGKKPSANSCSVCSHWHKDIRDTGECRRFPPVLIQSIPGSHLLPEGKLGIFPLTQATTTCGEFKSPTPL